MNQADAPLVSVFKTDDPALLPLATMALEAEGIEHMVKSSGKADTFEWMMGQPPTTRPRVMEIVVTSDVADRARQAVAELERAAPAAPAEPAAAAPVEPPTVHLERADTGAAVGIITEAQLQELSSHLDEIDPQQYVVDEAAVGRLKDAHADASLVALLKQAAAGGDLVIRWVVR